MELGQPVGSELRVALYVNKQLVQMRPVVARWRGKPLALVCPWTIDLPPAVPVNDPVKVNVAVRLLDGSDGSGDGSWLTPVRLEACLLPAEGTPRGTNALACVWFDWRDPAPFPQRSPDKDRGYVRKLIEEGSTWVDILSSIDPPVVPELRQSLQESQAFVSEVGDLAEGEIGDHGANVDYLLADSADGLICQIFFGD